MLTISSQYPVLVLHSTEKENNVKLSINLELYYENNVLSKILRVERKTVVSHMVVFPQT